MIILFVPSRLKGWLKSRTALLAVLEIVFWLILAMIAHTILFKYLESTDWMESWWQTWQTFTTVGYGNAPAETVSGRWATIFFGTIGIAFLGAFISVAFDIKQEKRNRRRYGMTKNPHKNGYILVNFPGIIEFVQWAQEIRTTEPDVGFCVIDNKIDELPPIIEATIGNVHFVNGSLLKEETYEQAGIRENKIVIIFPTDPLSADTDASTKAFVQIIEEMVDKTARIIYILVDPANDRLFRKCRATSILQTMEILALVQECQDEGIAPIIGLLLKNTEGARPQTYSLDAFDGISWGNFRKTFYSIVDENDIELDILGINHHGNPMILPHKNTKIAKGDLIHVVVADDEINWPDFCQKLRSKLI